MAMRTGSEIQIRIRPDGRVYIEGLSDGMLQVAAALSPGDPLLARRLKLLEEVRSRAGIEQRTEEQTDGNAETGE
jgi:hypothetical protein